MQMERRERVWWTSRMNPLEDQSRKHHHQTKEKFQSYQIIDHFQQLNDSMTTLLHEVVVQM